MIVDRANAPRRTILVTAFGAFPGSPRNPTEAIVAGLGHHAPRFRRLGIELRCATLPVRYAALADRMAALADEHRPDVILHLGVAGGRRHVSVETRAINRANPLRPDAAGARPAQLLMPGRTHIVPATYPIMRVLAAIRACGVDVATSRDAGDYACNATLFQSIAMGLAPEIGFIHVPKPRSLTSKSRPHGRRQPSPADLVTAALSAVLALTRPPPTPIALPSRCGPGTRAELSARERAAARPRPAVPRPRQSASSRGSSEL